MKKLLILDANAIIHRVYWALPKLTTKDGKVVNAVYGFLLILFKVLKDFKPDYIVATFDYPAPTFRVKVFKEYKAQRPKAPDDLYSQIPIVKKFLETLAIKIFEKEGYEADDLIGTIVERLKNNKDLEKIIITGDLDLLQLVDETTKVLLLRRGTKDAVLYDKEKVKEKYGLSPKQIPDFKALRGDPSDNLPGIPGIGEKTAIKLLEEFGSLENLFKSLSKLENSKIKEALINNKENAKKLKQLAEVQKNIEIDFNLEECRFGKFNKQDLVELLKKFEFNSLLKRIEELQFQKTLF